jgi:hypothetical protein
MSTVSECIQSIAPHLARVPKPLLNRLVLDCLLVAAEIRSACCTEYVRVTATQLSAALQAARPLQQLVVVDMGPAQACLVVNVQLCLRRVHQPADSIYISIFPASRPPHTAPHQSTLQDIINLCTLHLFQAPAHSHIVHAEAMFDVLPVLACSWVGWMLNYSFIYILTSDDELDRLSRCIVDFSMLNTFQEQNSHKSPWWKHDSCSDMIAGSLGTVDIRRHSLNGRSAWLFSVSVTVGQPKKPASKPSQRKTLKTNSFSMLDEDSVSDTDERPSSDDVGTEYSFSLPICCADRDLADSVGNIYQNHLDESHEFSGERFLNQLQSILDTKLGESLLRNQVRLKVCLNEVGLDNVGL